MGSGNSKLYHDVYYDNFCVPNSIQSPNYLNNGTNGEFKKIILK